MLANSRDEYQLELWCIAHPPARIVVATSSADHGSWSTTPAGYGSDARRLLTIVRRAGFGVNTAAIRISRVPETKHKYAEVNESL